jgi:ComF family protein
MICIRPRARFTINAVLEYILDFLFPPRCPACAAPTTEHGQICAGCWNKFNWISDPKCAKCGYPFPANIEKSATLLCPDCQTADSKLDWMRSAAVYDDQSRDMMLGFKHGGRLEFTGPMSRAMIALLRELPKGPFVVMPVPLALRRLWKRGYNQAAILARPIATRLNAPVDYDSVRRIYRADMGHKNARMRRMNVRGVFQIKRPDKINGKKILLVDDVHTTGATFDELARVLKKVGAKWVGGITFCRTVRAI